MNNWYGKVFKKNSIIKNIIRSFAKSFFVMSGICLISYGIMYFTGIYAKIERALDLKYNSPFIYGPLFLALLITAISLIVGCLLYFHKYKRTKTKTKFYNEITKIMGGEK